jgi:hypothetical protein
MCHVEMSQHVVVYVCKHEARNTTCHTHEHDRYCTQDSYYYYYSSRPRIIAQ